MISTASILKIFFQLTISYVKRIFIEIFFAKILNVTGFNACICLAVAYIALLVTKQRLIPSKTCSEVFVYLAHYSKDITSV